MASHMAVRSWHMMSTSDSQRQLSQMPCACLLLCSCSRARGRARPAAALPACWHRTSMPAACFLLACTVLCRLAAVACLRMIYARAGMLLLPTACTCMLNPVACWLCLARCPHACRSRAALLVSALQAAGLSSAWTHSRGGAACSGTSSCVAGSAGVGVLCHHLWQGCR